MSEHTDTRQIAKWKKAIAAHVDEKALRAWFQRIRTAKTEREAFCAFVHGMVYLTYPAYWEMAVKPTMQN